MADGETTIHVGWESRLSAIETNHLQLQKDVGALARDVSALTQAVKGISSSVEKIAATQSIRLRTPWAEILTGLGIIATIGWFLLLQPLQGLREHFDQHDSDGHPERVIEQIERVEQIVEANERALEARLDRKQEQLLRIEERLDEMSTDHEGMNNSIFNLERQVWPDTKYRAGRPN